MTEAREDIIVSKRRAVVECVPIFKVGERNVSVYRGVVVEWDEDFDTRAFEAVRIIQKRLKNDVIPINNEKLLKIAERKGSVDLMFSGDERNFGKEIYEAMRINGDLWSVNKVEYV